MAAARSLGLGLAALSLRKGGVGRAILAHLAGAAATPSTQEGGTRPCRCSAAPGGLAASCAAPRQLTRLVAARAAAGTQGASCSGRPSPRPLDKGGRGLRCITHRTIFRHGLLVLTHFSPTTPLALWRPAVWRRNTDTPCAGAGAGSGGHGGGSGDTAQQLMRELELELELEGGGARIEELMGQEKAPGGALTPTHARDLQRPMAKRLELLGEQLRLLTEANRLDTEADRLATGARPPPRRLPTRILSHSDC